MRHLDDLKYKAEQAHKKVGPVGPDIRFDAFDPTAAPHPRLEAEALAAALSVEDQNRLVMSGLDLNQKERAGTFFFKDTTVVHCSTRQEGLEIMPLRRALENNEWIGRYYWRLVPVDADKYTAAAELQLHDGYVIRALPGSRSIYPVQACLYMDKNKLQQNVHNIVIVEEGAELHMITGCAVSPHLETGLHVGISEFFVKRNAKLTFTMVHNWTHQVHVRPRSAAQVEAGGLFVSNYISLKPVGSLQMDPAVYLTGQGAVTRIYSIIAGSPGARYDIGGRVYLRQPHTRAEIIARTISNGGHITARGHLIGETPRIKAHLECRGLILNEGVIHAIPELEGRTGNVEMSHEAAVGKIAREEIQYLMARGQTEEQAVSTIIRGFLSIDIPELPPPLKKEIDRAIEALKQEMM